MAHQSPGEMASYERDRLYRLANKNLGMAGVLGFFLPPLAYLYIGKPRWALLNLVTLDYLLLGLILVPLHARRTIQTARDRVDELERAQRQQQPPMGATGQRGPQQPPTDD